MSLIKKTPLNWNGTHEWSDLMYARFLNVVIHEGGLTCELNDAAKYIGCSQSSLLQRLSRLKTMRYEYTLQKWSKTAKYVQYDVIENAVQHDLEELKMMILIKLPGTVNEADGVTVDVKFLFTTVNHKSLRSKIALTIVKEGLLKLMYNAARKFVVDNRPFNEIALFDGMFHNELPRSCFVNLYPIGITSGLKRHRDQSSFCSVVLCLLESEGHLILTTETNEEIKVHLKSNDMIVFSRISHYVEEVSRTKNRITINVFF
jgi:hypothetical protein